MSTKIIGTLVFIILAALALAMLANSMTKPLGRDEHMYCTAGALLARGKMIYRDFSYVAQMPYHPLICAFLYKTFNTTQYLLVGRVLSVVCDVLLAVCIVGIYRRIFETFPICGAMFGLAAAVLYIFNPFVDYANGFAWNHDMVFLCVVLSFWLFISIDFEQKSKYWRIALIGALLTLATCTRITTALAQLLFFIILLLRPSPSIKQKLQNIVAFLAGTACVLVWPLCTIIAAPRAFYLNLFWIPMLNSEWLRRMGMVYNKFDLIFVALTTPGYPLLILIAVQLWVTIILLRRKLKISNVTNLLLAALLPLAFFIIALMPPTMWKQYLAMPAPFLVISFAYPLLYIRKLTEIPMQNKHFQIARLLIAASALVSVSLYPVVLRRIPRLARPQNWVPIRLHSISQDIVQRTKSPEPILTLAPLYALEGGGNIYDEFSSGPFVYRIAPYMQPADRQLVRSVDPESLGRLLEKSPPAAIILGAEYKPLEAPFLQAIASHSQQWQVEVYDNGLIVYFRR
jgi:hypothetical protein